MKRRSRPGVNKNKPDPGMCMAVGCERKALYKNGWTKKPRGFCAAHREMASPLWSETTIEQKHDWMLRRWGAE